MLARVGRLLVGLTVATVIFFATGEALARAFGLVDRLNGYARQLFMAGPSATLPYLLRPGVEATFNGVRVRVNSRGVRGPEVPAVPASGTVRVLALGDSVVFGQGVEEEQTMSALLARRLSERWKLPVEVLNSGTQGYDTVAEAAYLAGPGRALTSSGVVVGMSLNDYDTAPSYDATGVLTRRPPGGAAPGVLARSEFLLLLRWLRAWSRGELLTQMLERTPAGGAPTPAQTAAAVDQMVAREHQRFYAAPKPEAWARMRDGFVALRDAAAAQGVWLVVAIFPESWQVGVDADLTPQRKLLALCAEAGVACLDLQPAFAAAGDGLFEDTQHPNARGHAVAAEAIAAALAPGS